MGFIAIDIIIQKDRIIGCEYKPKYDVVVALKNDEYEIDLQRLAKAMAHRDFKCLVISNKDEEKWLKLNMIESKVINYLKNQNRFEEDNSSILIHWQLFHLLLMIGMVEKNIMNY